MSLEKRCQGKGVEKDTGVRTERIFLMGQSKEVLTEQTREGIKGSSQVKTFWGEFPGRGKSTLENLEAGSP